MAALPGEAVETQGNPVFVHVELRKGVIHIPGPVVGDHLQGAGFGIVLNVIGHDKGYGLGAVLALDIPAAEIVAHCYFSFLSVAAARGRNL